MHRLLAYRSDFTEFRYRSKIFQDYLLIIIVPMFPDTCRVTKTEGVGYLACHYGTFYIMQRNIVKTKFFEI